MDTASLLPSLNLITLVGVLVLAIGSFLWFLRSKRNREAAKHVLKD